MAGIPDVGRTLGGEWVVDARLGEGGMGAVFRVRHEGTGQAGALKLLLPGGDDPEARDVAARRLRDEGTAAARLRHPNLVAVLATGEDETYGPFVVYELLPGTSLRDRLSADGPLPSWDAVMSEVALPLLSGLAALHDAGVVHRDLKPENLFESADRSLKVGDLGLAVFEGRGARTRTGVVMGTPGYLAPERLTSSADLSPASDVYAAAVILTVAATGRLPFTSTTATELVLEQTRTRIDAGRLRAAGLPGTVARILSRAMDPDPAARPPHARALWEELQSADMSLSSAGRTGILKVAPTRATSSPSSSPGRSSRRAGPVVAVGLLLLVLAGLGLHVRPSPDSSPGRNVETGRTETLIELAARPLTTVMPADLLSLMADLRRRVASLAREGTPPRTLLPALPGRSDPRTLAPLVVAAVASHYGDDGAAVAALRSVLDAVRSGPVTEDALHQEAVLLWELAHPQTRLDGPRVADAKRWDAPGTWTMDGEIERAEARFRGLVSPLRTNGPARAAQARLLFVRALTLAASEAVVRDQRPTEAPLVLVALTDLLSAASALLDAGPLLEAERSLLRERLVPLKIASLTPPGTDPARTLLDTAARARSEALKGRSIVTFYVREKRRKANILVLPSSDAATSAEGLSEAQAALKAMSGYRRTAWSLLVATLVAQPEPRTLSTAADEIMQVWQYANDTASEAGILRAQGWGPPFHDDWWCREARRCLAALSLPAWTRSSGPTSTEEAVIPLAWNEYLRALEDDSTMAPPPDSLSAAEAIVPPEGNGAPSLTSTHERLALARKRLQGRL